MRLIILNGRRMRSIRAAHRHIARRFQFPGWYGCNLDALADLLGEITTATHVRLNHPECLEGLHDGYGQRLWAVFSAVAAENPRLTVDVAEPSGASLKPD